MKVAKWGNSLGIRIPKDVVDALGLKEGDEIQLRPGEAGVLRVDRQMTREEAIRSLRRFRGTMPADYKFDREEANAR
jgi:antitoxin MazE